MYELKITDKFSAAHNLRNYGGKCEQLHGHTWKVDLSLEDKNLNEIGILCDFKDIKKSLRDLISRFDHTYINECSPFNEINPTAENLAGFFYRELKVVYPNIKKVTVWESENARASYWE